MKKLFKPLKGEQGVALVTIILILLLLLTLGSVLLSISTIEKKISFNQKRAIQALYLAEAGVNLAIAELRYNPYLLDTIPVGQAYDFVNQPIALGTQGGTIKSVTLTKELVRPNQITISIESTGEVSSFQRRVITRMDLIRNAITSLTVRSSSGRGGLIVGDVYLYGSGPHLISEVNGNVWAEGSVTVKNGTVTGDVQANGSIRVEGSGAIEGRIVEYAGITIELPPPVDFNWYKVRANQKYVGNKRFSANDNLTGIVFVEGNVDVTGFG